jgi:hypothetical protein
MKQTNKDEATSSTLSPWLTLVYRRRKHYVAEILQSFAGLHVLLAVSAVEPQIENRNTHMNAFHCALITGQVESMLKGSKYSQIRSLSCECHVRNIA